MHHVLGIDGGISGQMFLNVATFILNSPPAESKKKHEKEIPNVRNYVTIIQANSINCFRSI